MKVLHETMQKPSKYISRQKYWRNVIARSCSRLADSRKGGEWINRPALLVRLPPDLPLDSSLQRVD